MVDSEYLNFFKSQQATTTDFISFYFLLHQEATTPRKAYWVLLQSLTTRYPKGLPVHRFYHTYPFDCLSFHKRLFLSLGTCSTAVQCTLELRALSLSLLEDLGSAKPQEILPVARSSSSVKHHYSDTILRSIRKSFVYLPSNHILICFLSMI